MFVFSDTHALVQFLDEDHCSDQLVKGAGKYGTGGLLYCHLEQQEAVQSSSDMFRFVLYNLYTI